MNLGSGANSVYTQIQNSDASKNSQIMLKFQFKMQLK